ncbi:hypothetical protein MMYC01_202773 [Madurella mycetomatis]|uniref:Uncharacterized protein n=1 Tax=Madurella mycetomatis TaxID=100816 RepID=A0A175WBF0_9PEZI|nr:hypothetical protein MMYC01_202773 [Madurella mycetomatis]
MVNSNDEDDALGGSCPFRNNATQPNVRMQKENVQLYRELLRSGRFEGWKGESEDLAFRLILAWFGLPVRPLKDGDGELDDGADDKEDDGSEEEDERVGDLGWLDCYTKRGRVSDEEETSGSVSHNLSLRGGAFGGVVMSSVLREIQPRGTATSGRLSRWSATPGLLALLETFLGGDIVSVKERWIPPYGYQEIVWFRIDKFYNFVDAVGRLLCLGNRAGVMYSLYLLDKRKTYESGVERDEFLQDEGNNGLTIWCAGVGDYSNDHLAWE